MEPIHITVLAGGPGAEREVSLRSGAAVVRALQALGHSVSQQDPADQDWALPAQTEVVFLALHGEYGEDGTVQRLLEGQRVPYTGTGPRGSALAWDKAASKTIFEQHDISTPRWALLENAYAAVPVDIPPPWVLKPALQGSSVGLQMADALEGWSMALAASARQGGAVLCEERISGREITVGILDGVALPIVEIEPKAGHYDYENKYTVGATEYHCPAQLNASVTAHVSELSLRAWRAVEGRHFGRVDLMLDTDLKPFVLEVNTLPGLTETSLLPKAAAAAGIPFDQLCQRMVELALEQN